MDPRDPLGIIQHAEMLSDLSPEAVDALVRSRRRVAPDNPRDPPLAAPSSPMAGSLTRWQRRRPVLDKRNRRPLPRDAEGVKDRIALLAGRFVRTKTGETFVNFMEEDPPREGPRRLPARGLGTLVDLKDEHDPHNLFRFNRNIPPSGETGPAERNGGR